MNIFNLFPTPVGYISGVITQNECNNLIDVVVNSEEVANHATDKLTHTSSVDTLKGEHIQNMCRRLSPYIKNFGYQLLGDNSLDWHIVGLWGNVMVPGGYQYKHNHGNSIMSGVLYLQMPKGSTATRFWRKERGDTYFLAHDGQGRMTDYNCQYVDLNNVRARDLVLFPSHMQHGVEENNSDENRISIAFNAVPDRINILDTYYLKLSS